MAHADCFRFNLVTSTQFSRLSRIAIRLKFDLWDEIYWQIECNILYCHWTKDVWKYAQFNQILHNSLPTCLERTDNRPVSLQKNSL